MEVLVVIGSALLLIATAGAIAKEKVNKELSAITAIITAMVWFFVG